MFVCTGNRTLIVRSFSSSYSHYTDRDPRSVGTPDTKAYSERPGSEFANTHHGEPDRFCAPVWLFFEKGECIVRAGGTINDTWINCNATPKKREGQKVCFSSYFLVNMRRLSTFCTAIFIYKKYAFLCPFSSRGYE